MAEKQAAVALLLSAKGGIVCVDGRGDELILTGISDGTSKAGWAVFKESTIGADCGKMVGLNVNSSHDHFAGIQIPKYNTDADSVVTAGELVEYVVPKSGHKYVVYAEDPSTGHKEGETVALAGNATGQFTVQAGSIEAVHFLAYTTEAPASTSRFIEIIWK